MPRLRPATWPRPSQADQARYIWDLAFDSQGALYIATGGPAAIYRVDVSTDTPHAEVFFESDEQHIRCLLFEPNGNLIAGSDGGGLVYRIGKDRKGLVIYDAPKREVTALAESADGRLYVAAVGEKTKSTLPPLPVQGIAVATATITIVTPGSVQASSSNGLIPDGSEVDELSPQGAPRKLWATRDDVVYALRATPQGLLAATGNRGRIYRINEDGSYLDLARAATGQATAFADAPDGLYVATSNTGRLYKLGSQPAAQGTYLSDVLDSGVFSQFGRMEVNCRRRHRRLRDLRPLRQRGEPGAQLERVAQGNPEYRLVRRARRALCSVEGSARAGGSGRLRRHQLPAGEHCPGGG